MHMAEGAGASRIRRAGAIGCEDGFGVVARVGTRGAEVTLVLIDGEGRREIRWSASARLPLLPAERRG